MDKSAKNTAFTTKDNTRTQYREKNNRENATENENRAYNNHTNTGYEGKQFLLPRFLPSEIRKGTQVRKYTQRKRKPLRGKENGEIDDVMG